VRFGERAKKVQEKADTSMSRSWTLGSNIGSIQKNVTRFWVRLVWGRVATGERWETGEDGKRATNHHKWIP